MLVQERKRTIRRIPLFRKSQSLPPKNDFHPVKLQLHFTTKPHTIVSNVVFLNKFSFSLGCLMRDVVMYLKILELFVRWNKGTTNVTIC